MKVCKVCGCEIEEDDVLFDGAAIINKGMDSEHALCYSCLSVARYNGKVVQCDACGENFTVGALYDEKINGHSFTACPACGKDMVEGLTRESFAEEYRPYRYAVTVRYSNGPRGYVVSADAGKHGVSAAMKKLADKVDLSGAMEITIAEILLEEDEF